jgi:TonB-linked SusC/RagA family outer membrane protein
MSSALAQKGRIVGRVVRAVGDVREPVSGAEVHVPGSSMTTTVDSDGRYALTVDSGTYNVQARAIGFAPVTQVVKVAPGADVTVDFLLSPRVVTLNEVVTTVAASNSRRVELGTDIERLDVEAATDKAAVTNFSQLLNARVTGVSVTQSSGTVGGASKIRIRGSTSLTQDNNPLIYVDGIRVSNETGTGPGSYDFGNGQTISRLDDINPQDIASIQVMKGPTAAALYGSEAAAGVIMIETKQGKSGGNHFSFSTQQGVLKDVSDYYDNYYNLTKYGGFTDINEPVIQQFRPVQNPATGDIYARNNPMKSPLSSPLRTGRNAQYTLSARGGAAALNYFGSVSYEDQSGTLPNNNLNRFSFRANVKAQPSEKLDLALNSAFISRNVRMPDNDRSGVGMVTNAGAGQPISSYGVNPDGSRGDCLGTLISGAPASTCDARQGNLTANFDKLATISNTQDVDRAVAGIQLHWRPVGWLTNRLVTGIDFIQTADVNFVPVDPDAPFGPDSRGFIADRRTTHRTVSFDYAATAQARLSSALNTSTTVGAQYFQTHNRMVGCTGSEGFASNTAIACDAALTFSGSSNAIENVEIGALFQQHFDFKGYLFATGGVRVDDNSAFGEEEGAIWSPSANLSAVISDMPFWNVAPRLVNDLRLRLAWGTAAQAPSPFAHSQTLEPVRLAAPDGSQMTGVSLRDPGNPDLTAERNAEWEVGFDSRLANDRVGLKFTYFNQRTTDAILQTSVAPSTGFTGAKFVNIGKIENHGIEALLDARILERENLIWDAQFKFSTENPKVTELGGQPPITFGLEADHQMFREGFAPGAYYGHIVQHAERDGNGDIIPESIVLAPGTVGDPGAPNDVYLGRAEPSNLQSLSTTLTLFGGLQIYTLFDRAGGFVKYDDSNAFRSPFLADRTGSRKFAFRKAESTPEEQAMMEMGNEERNAVFIEDASFVKWRELTLTYSLPTRITDRWLRADAVSIALGARNLHTWTKYGGLDPELSYDGGQDSFNTDEFFTQPPSRSLFVRLNVNF